MYIYHHLPTYTMCYNFCCNDLWINVFIFFFQEIKQTPSPLSSLYEDPRIAEHSPAQIMHEA